MCIYVVWSGVYLCSSFLEETVDHILFFFILTHSLHDVERRLKVNRNKLKGACRGESKEVLSDFKATAHGGVWLEEGGAANWPSFSAYPSFSISVRAVRESKRDHDQTLIAPFNPQTHSCRVKTVKARKVQLLICYQPELCSMTSKYNAAFEAQAWVTTPHHQLISSTTKPWQRAGAFHLRLDHWRGV